MSESFLTVLTGAGKELIFPLILGAIDELEDYC